MLQFGGFSGYKSGTLIEIAGTQGRSLSSKDKTIQI